MRTLTQKEIGNIEKALTHHINYKLDFNGTPVSLEGVPKKSYSPDSSSLYLRVLDYMSMNNQGSMAEKLSFTLKLYFDYVGVSNLNEALKRLKHTEDTQQIKQGL